MKLNAEIAERLRFEWDADKNNCVFLEAIENPDETYAWKCSKNHEWNARLRSRVARNSKCPYCSGHRAIKGVNDVATLYPELVKEFHPTKNGNVKLEDYKENSAKKVWWICEKGHEWETQINLRTKHNCNCPICSHQKIVAGINDFATIHPELAKEVSATGNEGIDITKLSSSSSQILTWQCPNGHFYKTTIKQRTSRGQGCPYCSRYSLTKQKKNGVSIVRSKLPIAGVNDLGTIHPEVKKYWDYETNGSIANYTQKSSKMVAWKCEYGHKWNKRILQQVKCNDCPYCSGRMFIKGVNDVATVYPELITEWDIEGNGKRPEDVKASTGLSAIWRCENGHTWKSTIANRCEGKGCPYCTGKLPIKEENDLLTKYPRVAEEWDYELNPKNPEDYLPKSSIKAHWKCKKGHKWEAIIASRCTGAGCPYCAGKLPIKGENDLLTKYPWVAEEWDYDLNRKKPEDYLPKSNIKVNWKCKKGHKWKAQINARTSGTNCPICAKEESS